MTTRCERTEGDAVTVQVKERVAVDPFFPGVMS
jgi:hypothetical protein